MVSSEHEFTVLGPSHNRTDFSCGVEALDRYLRQQASQDARRNIAAVFVLNDDVANRIVGYYTLSATALTAAALPPELARTYGRYPTLPAVLIGRLAVDSNYRGRGIGQLLLINALRRALSQSGQVAAMAVVVDAIDDTARRFYEHHGFQAILDDPRRLFITMATIAREWS